MKYEIDTRVVMQRDRRNRSCSGMGGIYDRNAVVPQQAYPIFKAISEAEGEEI